MVHFRLSSASKRVMPHAQTPQAQPNLHQAHLRSICWSFDLVMLLFNFLHVVRGRKRKRGTRGIFFFAIDIHNILDMESNARRPNQTTIRKHSNQVVILYIICKLFVTVFYFSSLASKCYLELRYW